MCGDWDRGCRVWGAGYGIQDVGCRMQDVGYGVWGAGYGAWGCTACRVRAVVWGLRCRAPCGCWDAPAYNSHRPSRPEVGASSSSPPGTAPSADYTSRHPAHRKWASPRGRGFRRRPRGGASRAKMAAAAVLEFQRAQSLLSTDREASIGILHSIGEPRGSPRSLGRLPADPRPLRPAARPAADSRRGAACWARGGGSGMAGIGVGAGWGLGFAAPRGVGL